MCWVWVVALLVVLVWVELVDDLGLLVLGLLFPHELGEVWPGLPLHILRLVVWERLLEPLDEVSHVDHPVVAALALLHHGWGAGHRHHRDVL